MDPNDDVLQTASEQVPQLTGREREVLALMAEGRSNDAIRSELEISAKTLERHVQHVFSKLGLEPDRGNHRRVLAVLAWQDACARGRVTPPGPPAERSRAGA